MLFSHRVYLDWNWEPDVFFMYPCNGPLWFMRNLFLISLAAPIVFMFVKHIRPYIGFPILVILYVTKVISSGDVGMVSTFCFFTMGAYIGMNRWNVLPFIAKKGIYIMAAYIVCIFVDLAIMDTVAMHEYLFRFAIILGLPSLAYATYRLPSKYKNVEFPSLSMFIYCAHSIFLVPVLFLTRRSGMQCMTLVFAINVFVTVFLCIIGYLVVRKWMPVRIVKALMGERI